MFNVKRLAKYLATGTLPERTALDEAIELYEEVKEQRSKGRGQRSEVKGQTVEGQSSELTRKLQAMDTTDLADYLHAHEDDETTPEFRACKKEIDRRDAIYHGKHLDDLGEQA